MTMLMDDPPICKCCGYEIFRGRIDSEDWDGETCSYECEETLKSLSEDTSWSDEDDEWMELDAARYYGNSVEDD